MHSKLYSLLSSLNNKMLISIESYLNATFGSNHEYILLYNAITRHLAAPTNQFIKESIFADIYPDKSFDDQKWRLINSQVLKKIERHLAVQKILENNELMHLKILETYKELNLKSHYESHLKTARKSFANARIKDTNHHDLLIELEHEQSEFLLSQKRNQKLNIQETLDQVDISFLIKKLKFACSALAHESVFSINYDYGILQIGLESIKYLDLSQYPALDLYYSCYLMLREPDQLDRFVNFRKNISRYQNYFKKSEIRSIYLLGINMCIRRLNKGDQQFGKIGLEMYEEALNNKHLFINNKLSRYSYRNIAMMAIRSGDFIWANKFTEDYKVYLKKSDMNSAYHLNKALIHYHQSELEAARDNIIEADFKDHLINLAAKTLQAKIYFELDEYNLLLSHLDSMEMYIIRKKVLGYHKQNYKNFISFSRKLIRLPQYDKKKKLKLKDQINEEKILIEKKWFNQQLA